MEIGTVVAYQPSYDVNGFISLQYVPTIQITKDVKLRQFLMALDIEAQNGGVLSLNFEKVEQTSTGLNFLYSSNLCRINSISLSVVIFDPSTPGLLFVDGQIEQNSLSTTT